MIRKIAALSSAVALGLFGVLMWSAPAQAGHNTVVVDVEVDGCTVSASSQWTEPGGTHKVANAALVVLANGEITTGLVGEGFTVELDPGTTSVQWRVWGGGERDYDLPVLLDLPALLYYLDSGGSPLDAAAPGVNWYTKYVGYCSVPATESPSPSPSESASPSPSPDESPSPSPSPDESPSPSPSESESPSPSPSSGESPSPSPSESDSPTPTETTSPPVVGGSVTKPDGGGLPLTGLSLMTLGGVGLVAAGGGAVMMMVRRRKAAGLNDETAEIPL